MKTNWERYKNSEEGKNVIAQFNRLTSLECTAEEMYAVIKRFNPLFARNSTDKEDANNIEAIASVRMNHGISSLSFLQSEFPVQELFRNNL